MKLVLHSSISAQVLLRLNVSLQFFLYFHLLQMPCQPDPKTCGVFPVLQELDQLLLI